VTSRYASSNKGGIDMSSLIQKETRLTVLRHSPTKEDIQKDMRKLDNYRERLNFVRILQSSWMDEQLTDVYYEVCVGFRQEKVVDKADEDELKA